MAKAKKIQNEMLGTQIRLDAHDFIARIKKLAPFMSREATRYYLCGALMRYSAGKLTLVATNGHILQEQVFTVADTGSPDFSVICPYFAIKALPKMIGKMKPVYDEDDEDEEVLEDDFKYETLFTLKVEPGTIKGKVIKFIFSDWEFTVTAIDGIYPDYQKVITDSTKATIMAHGLALNYVNDVSNALGNTTMDVFAESNVAPHLFVSPDQAGIKCVVMPRRNVV